MLRQFWLHLFTIHNWSKFVGVHESRRLFWLPVSLCESFLWVVNHWWPKRLVAAIEAPVRWVGWAANQKHHIQNVGGGGVLGLSPALLKDLVASKMWLIHVDLVLFQVAGIIGCQVFQVEMNPLSRIYLDGPVAPQRRVGAEVIWGEKLTSVTMQQLVAAPQGEESTIATSVSIWGRNRPSLVFFIF